PGCPPIVKQCFRPTYREDIDIDCAVYDRAEHYIKALLGSAFPCRDLSVVTAKLNRMKMDLPSCADADISISLEDQPANQPPDSQPACLNNDTFQQPMRR
ncbi:hypothetical protein WJX84_004024, partial [Apatococcus fuscideae]